MSETKGKDEKVEQNEIPNGEKNNGKKKPQGSFFQLMDSNDKFLWRFGAFFAFLGGARFPITSLFLGEMFDTLGRPGQTNFVEQVIPYVVILIIAGVVSGLLRACSDVSIAVLQQRMVTKFQYQYLDTLLRKDSKWYDERGAATLLGTMTTSCFQVNDLFGPELATCIMGLSAFVLSTCVAISRSWQLGLIMVVSLPLMILATMIAFKKFMLMSSRFNHFSGAAGLHLEQAIRGIATVQAYALEQRVVTNIEPWVRMCYNVTVPLARKGSLLFAFRMCMEWFVVATMFFVGSRFVIAKTHNPMTGSTWEPGDIFSVWFIQYMGISQLQLSLGYAQSFGEGKGALLALKTLQEEECSEIEGPSRKLSQQLKAIDIEDRFKDINLIEFDNVTFRYPSRPDRLVLDSVSFEVRKGQKLALVGESGSGKSTIIQLLERFYNVDSGEIRVNGVNIEKLPLATLRRCMALVEQEPVLFATSLRNNLEYADSRASFSEERLEEVLTSCCMDFVSSLPSGVNTYVGARGNMLSGGQKQRTCIARALLREPKLLLLDEATAALDNQTEKSVQETLDKVVQNAGFTSVTVAHRLSTIRSSDHILVFKQGRIVEQGSHDALVELGSGGLYYGLVKLQEVAASGLESASPETSAIHQQIDKDAVARCKSIKTVIGGKQKKEDATVDLSQITPRKLSAVLPKLLQTYFERPALAITLVLGWSGLACMSMIQPIFASVLISMMTGLYMEGDEREKNANISSLQLFGLGVLNCFFVNGRIYVINLARSWQQVYTRNAITSNLMHQDISFFDNPECTAAKIITIFTALIMQADQLCTNLVPEVIGAICTVCLTFALAMTKQTKIAVVVAAVWPVNMISKYLEFRDLLAKMRRGKSANAETASAQIFHDCIVHLKTVRASQCEDKMVQEFLELVQQEGFTSRRGRVQTGVIKGVAYALELGLFAFAFWWTAKVMDEGEAFEDCMEAMMVIILGLMPVTSILNAFDALERKVEAGARILDLRFHRPTVHKTPPKLSGVGGLPSIEPLEVVGSVLSFDQVRFTYAQRPDVEVLKSISFKVQLGSGNMVGFCGPSGGGKSTVLSMISRYYDPTEGSITIEGLGDLRTLDVQRWRRCIGLVQQEPVLFQDTLLNNVRYGNPKATPEELKQAAKMAHLDFASDEPLFDQNAPMPQPRILMGGELKALNITQEEFDRICRSVQGGDSKGAVTTQKSEKAADTAAPTASAESGRVSWYDTVRDTNLSGGQKQRVAIARAFLRNPTVLIFDEATSALDSYSEKVVQDSLVTSRPKQTQFLIAHRLSTISEASLILVVSMGVVVETGTSEELLEKRGVYYSLAHGKH